MPRPADAAALGHNPKAVHQAYSKHAEVTVPSLDDWEKQWQKTEGGGRVTANVVELVVAA